MRRKPPPVRPPLCDKVHAALLKAGRPVTRGEISQYWLTSSTFKVLDIQAALDVLVAEGLATRGEERKGWRVFEVYRAV